MRIATRTLLLAMIASPLAGQAGSSQGYFLSSVELASGSNSSSASYSMCTVLGAAVVPAASASSNFKITGGYAATLDVSTSGAPWLTGVTPMFVTPKSAVTLSLSGTGLDLSANPTITIGGVNTTALTQQNHAITAKLPFVAGPPSSPGPGWRSARVTNIGGTSTLSNAVGILPMLMADPAPAPNTAFDIVFKGSPGDQILWVIGVPPLPPIPIGNNLHGLAVNPLVTMPSLAITNGNGELRLPIDPVAYQGPFFAQALFVTSNPGYAPGSFSNVLKF